MRLIDPPLARFAKNYVRSDQTVWDVGANVGFFTFIAAGFGARVLSIEADTWLAENLRWAAAKQSMDISVIPSAVSDRCGIAEFLIASASRSTNYLAEAGGTTMTGGFWSRQLVPTVRLDDLLEHSRPPDVLKVDVEGGEVMVLKGASRVLQSRPVLLLEVAQRNHADVDQILSPLGYEYTDAETQRTVRAIVDNTIAVCSR